MLDISRRGISTWAADVVDLKNWVGAYPPVRVRVVALTVSALGVLALAVALRIWRLGGRSFKLDEAALFWIAQGDVRAVLDQNAAYNSAPPFFALLIAALATVDHSEAFLRVAPAFFGVLLVPAVYWAARAFAGPGWALLAALITAVSPPAVDMSQYLREYSLAMLLATLLLGAATRYLVCHRSRDAALTIALAAAAIQVQYGLALVVAAVGVALAVSALIGAVRGGPILRPFGVLAMLGLAVLVSVWVAWMTALSIQYQPGGWGGDAYLRPYYLEGGVSAAPRFLLLRLARLLAMPFHGYEASAVVSTVATVIVAVALLLALRWPRSRPFAILALAAISVTAAAALARRYPFGSIRQNLMLVAPLYALIPAAVFGLNSLLRRVLPHPVALSVVAALVLAQLVVLVGRTAEIVTFQGWEDMRTVVQALERERAPNEPLVLDVPAKPQYYYYIERRDAARHAPDHRQTAVSEILHLGPLPTPAEAFPDALAQPGSFLVLTLEHSWTAEAVSQAAPPRTVTLVARSTDVALYRVSAVP